MHESAIIHLESKLQIAGLTDQETRAYQKIRDSYLELKGVGVKEEIPEENMSYDNYIELVDSD